MTTTYSIRIDENLKKSFLKKSKEKGIDGSVLLRHFMERFTENPEIVKFEIDEKEFDDMFKNPKIVNALNKLSDKLDELGF